MTTLYVPLHLPARQAESFLNRELRYRQVDSCQRRGNMLVIEHYPISILHMTAEDIRDYYGMNGYSIIV